jgi:hypothetical protein
VAGTPNSRTFIALTPLLSHTTARSRQAGTSFGSQPSRAAGGSRASQPEPLNATTPAHFHPGRLAPSTPILNWAGVCAFSLSSLVAQRDAEVGDTPGSSSLLRPWWLEPRWSAPLRRSRAWPPAGFGTAGCPGLVSISGQASRSETPAASVSSWPGSRRTAPPPAVGLAVRMRDPARHAATDEDAEALAIQDDPVGGM